MKRLLLITFIFLPSIDGLSQLVSGPDKEYLFQYEWREYFDNVDYVLDPIEGIWEQSYVAKNLGGTVAGASSTTKKSYVAIFRRGFDIELFDLNEAFHNHRSIRITEKDLPYTYNYLLFYKQSNNRVRGEMSLSGNFLRFSYIKPSEQIKWENGTSLRKNPDGKGSRFNHFWTKVYPKNPTQTPSSNYPSNPPKGVSCGTGFAVTRDGYIITNHHVIESARGIIVKDVNTIPNKEYKADVIISDAKNDIAILKISDPNYRTSIPIPFAIRGSSAEVGETVFALGYPLTSTMGMEVKLTNGIISSRSGFQGDITSYQISVPIQPGNSGGPLFDSNGDLVGIINAKHRGTDNVSYAIKVLYLRNIFDLIDNPIHISSTNTIKNKSLPDKVKSLRKLVFLVEAYY